MAASTSLQVANPALGTVTRQPQTSQNPASKGAPFVRQSKKSTKRIFDQSAVAIGNPINQAIKPVGGYYRGLKLEVIASGGSGTGVAYAADGPFNVINLLQLTDPFGQPIFVIDGFGLYLVDMFSGQWGEFGYSDLLNDPAQSNVSTVVTTTGSFTIPFYLPFEFDTAGYGALIGLSAAAEMQLDVSTNPLATVYATTPATTAPTLEFRMYADFWAAPVDDASLAPPGIGSSVQWSRVRAPANWAQSTNDFIAMPVQNTWISDLIIAMRDQGASMARVAQFPSSDLTLYVDGVPVVFESLNHRKSKMFREFGLDGAVTKLMTPPTGVIAYSFRNDANEMQGQASTHDYLMYTTPSTLLELGGTSGSGGTGPFRLDVYAGSLYAKGGVPYSHLAA